MAPGSPPWELGEGVSRTSGADHGPALSVGRRTDPQRLLAQCGEDVGSGLKGRRPRHCGRVRSLPHTAPCGGAGLLPAPRDLPAWAARVSPVEALEPPQPVLVHSPWSLPGPRPPPTVLLRTVAPGMSPCGRLTASLQRSVCLRSLSEETARWRSQFQRGLRSCRALGATAPGILPADTQLVFRGPHAFPV